MAPYGDTPRITEVDGLGRTVRVRDELDGGELVVGWQPQVTLFGEPFRVKLDPVTCTLNECVPLSDGGVQLKPCTPLPIPAETRSPRYWFAAIVATGAPLS